MKKMHIYSHSCGSDIIDALGTVEEDVDIKLELELQLERERKSASEFPEFYKLADVMESHEGASYRSGELDGKRFMTNDDYNRFILEKTEIANYGMGTAASYTSVRRPAAAYQVVGCGKEMVGTGFASSVCENVIYDNSCSIVRMEGSDTNIKGYVRRLIDQWFPTHMAYKQDRAYLRRFASSAAGIAWVLIFALVLSLPIVLGVLKSDAVYQLNEKQDELYLLEKTEERLRAEFESGLDLREIESIAVNEIGMIKLNDSTIRVLRLNDFDSIESFSDKKANSVVPALLSALGIRVEGE